ncbi:unnamed protein product [Prorocentrum cordatum]|uniref:Uncharacterized protein n=1 Tax=Prorocentrum cordatum TaxID=2364126 RepID=A0ABN9SXB1_9DINO|nr:unnamed protein product [Polarella glacialis]
MTSRGPESAGSSLRFRRALCCSRCTPSRCPCGRTLAPRLEPPHFELKLQVLFGEVVGGTLNTHPQLLWVTRAGCVQLWDLPDLQERGHNRCRQLERLYGRALPQEVLCLLRQVLRRDWQMIRGTSEKVTRSAGLDELRVDWLLGDEFWGSRIGELTYMGAGSRVTPPLSRRLARAYAAGHLVRLGRVSIELDAEGHNNSDALWPTDELRPDRTRRYQTLYCIHITVVVIEYSHTLTIV